jgi:hypothetical protein
MLVLIWNPLTILGAGFQYSFTIAGFLVLSWKSVKRWFICINERNLWDPNYGKNWKAHWHRIRNASLNSLFCSFTAWSAGAGLNLFHRNFFVPGAIFANFIILPFVWLLFLMAAMDIILFPLRNILYINILLEILLKIINSLSLAAATCGGGLFLHPPPYWMLIIFFISLMMFVTAKNKKIATVAASLIILNVICWYANPFLGMAEPYIAMFVGGESQEPALIVVPVKSDGITIFNVGSKKRAKNMLNYLTGNGINSIDTLYLLKSNKDACAGTDILLSGIEVKHILFPKNYKRSKYARFAMRSAIRSGTYIDLIPVIADPKTTSKNFMKYYRNNFTIIQKNNKSKFTLSYLKNQFTGEITESHLGEHKILLNVNERSFVFNLMNSNTLKLYIAK